MAFRPQLPAAVEVTGAVVAALVLGAAAGADGDARGLLLIAGALTATMVAAVVAQRSRSAGIDVLLDTALVSGVIVFLGRAAGLELPEAVMSRGVELGVVGAGLLALVAALSSASGSGRQGIRPLLLVAGTAALLGGGLTAVFDVAPAAVAPALAAGAVLLLAHAVAARYEPVVHVRARLERVSFVRLGIVVIAVAAGPFTLAAAAVELAPSPSSPVSAVPLAVLAMLGITHLARQLDQRSRLEHLALHDELTGLPNRVLFVDRLDNELAVADDDTPTTVLFVDVDRFKRVNDSLGHPAGDDLLQAVAARLRNQLRDNDIVARLGGDEFAVLLPDADEDLGRAIAERMLEAVGEPVAVAGHEVFVGASIGIAVAPDHGADTMTLLKNADAAMYAAKAGGRNRCNVYHRDLNAMAEARLDLETALHRALESNDGLVVHYQPKVDLERGRLIGAEALVRWEHPTRGLLQPNDFIPMAEDSGLIVALGEWVLHQTCSDLKRWTDEGGNPIVVSVNLSARQFEHQPIADVVASVLRRTGLDPGQLELELTESLALQEPARVLAVLEDLRSLGVSCSIDDFGTGYSGLNYLTRFPIDRLKIDKSFIAQIAAGGRDAQLASAVIALAHGLGLGVVAEGVETKEQLAFLRAHGCDQMQGYLVSRPVPAGEFERLLADEPVGSGHESGPLASVHLLRRGASSA